EERGREEKRIGDDENVFGVDRVHHIASRLVGIVVHDLISTQQQLGLPACVSLLDGRVMVMWEENGDRHLSERFILREDAGSGGSSGDPSGGQILSFA